MSAAALRALVDEARRVGFAVRDDVEPEPAGPVAVSGMLAEQLVKELSAGADPGSVVVGGAELAARAEVLVRIVAGDPTEDDGRLVAQADARGTPVVIVQLWPQADWTRPFVLTPFVVECRAGEGFPLREIGDRIVEAAENDVSLAARVPVLGESARAGAIRSAVIRSGLIGLAGSRLGVSRPLLTLEQVRLLSRLRTVSGSVADDELRVRAAGAGAVLASGFALRGAARSLRSVLPAPLANAAVAAGGTWALAKLAELADAKLSAR
ncbi:MAG TPA: hypothetical protein VFQ08_12020 [Gaiella sp.]|nr:hypothetical protein [Gaiella sp.]